MLTLKVPLVDRKGIRVILETLLLITALTLHVGCP